MVIGKLIKKSYFSIMENPSISLLFVAFLIVFNLFANFAMKAQTPVVYLLLKFCMFAVVCVFLSGWIQVIKETIDREKIKEKNFYSIFLEGIGKNIVTSILAIFICFVLFICAIFVAQEIALHTFGKLDFLFQDLQNIPQNSNAMWEYFSALDTDKKFAIYGWNLCFFLAICVLNFLFLFYFPSTYSKVKKNLFLNPFINIFSTLKFTFKNFFSVLGVYLLIVVGYFTIMFLNVAFAKNTILSVLFLLIGIYFVSFVVMLIFNYYDEKSTPKDTICDNGSDCLGQDDARDTNSEEN